MKRKMVNLTLSLILIFSLAAIVAPVGGAPEVKAQGYTSGVYGGHGSYTLTDYDVRYVAIDPLVGGGDPGDDTTGDGSEMDPWRTITHAESQLPYDDPEVDDMIIVGPSAPTWYGGAVPENIVVDNPVTIVSRDGALDLAGDMLTGINVAGQGLNTPLYVIEIVCDDVIIDDLFLTGTEVGVHAASPYIENVKVLNCVIKVDEVTEGVGIEMFEVKYAVIDGNTIYVGTEGGDLALSVDMAWGIIMFDCFTAQITNNEIDVHGDFKAIGIEMDQCPKSLVGVLPTGDPGPNDIEVLAAGDVVAIGIKVKNSHLIDIMYNTVAVEANGNSWAVGYGIKIKNSDRSDVIANTVYVEVNLIGNGAGFLMGRGIAVKYCHESNVVGNHVTVAGTGNINETIFGPDTELDEDIAEDLAELEPVLLDTLGIDQSLAIGMGTLVGISVKGSEAVNVIENTVGINLSVDVVSGDMEFAAGGGGGCAIGISALGSPGIHVGGNGVTVNDVVRTWVTAMEIYPVEVAFGGGISVALGITLIGSPGAVTGNGVNANADLLVDIESIGVFPVMEAESALARVDAEILGAIYLQLDEALGDEAIDVQLSGDLPGMQSLGLGGGIAAGIGILVLDSHVVAVVGNAPVSGTGYATADVWSYEELPTDPALAAGGGLGLGIGIAIIDTRGATVEGNQGVNGAGTADVDIGAQHGAPIAMFAGAAGGGAGIGIGILLCGMHDFELEAEQLPEDQCWPHRPVVINNTVTATGVAAPINVSAADLIESHEACAIGGGLGLAMGIASLWYPWIIIEGNTVDADADAYTDVESEAVHEFDPASIGGAAAIGIGITTVGCFHAAILDNVASGDGIAYSEIGATEKVVMSANAFGGSLGLGVGIFVIFSPCSLVQGNSELEAETCLILDRVTGRGDAECVVVATSYIPLSDAYAFSLASGIGIGIKVACSPRTDVVRCNAAAGEGTARVSATYDADFGAAGAAGFAGSYDILMKQLFGGDFGVVQYNSIVDDVPIGTNTPDLVATMDAGLLKMGPYLNAMYNWWNHPTGPMPIGLGELVIGFGPPVDFAPWLYVEHGEVLCYQIGKFGFFIPMCKGLNTLSTPIALEENTWGQIAANSGLSVASVDRWDSASQAWVGVAPSDTLEPLDAYYVYLLYPGNAILYVSSTASMPTRDLTAEWNLIGPNPLFSDPGMPAKPALSSVELTPGGLPGYTQCISPIVWCQEAWVFTPDMPGPGPLMRSGKGYWLWMENPDTLVGFGFTPLPAGP